MTEQVFYVEDTCTLKSKPTQTGIIDRTFSDVSTHRPDPLRHYPNELDRSKTISKQAFKSFLQSGIPPRHTVLVTWVHLPRQSNFKSTLIPEAELNLVDRALLVGDIVKRSSRDAISGTVVHLTVKTTLIPPKAWPEPNSQETPTSSSKDVIGNFSVNPCDLLHNIPADELIAPGLYEVGSFVIYKDWVGTIDHNIEEVAVRLKDGSVVVVHNSYDLDSSSLTETVEVGDFVTTKKANLRCGRWIFGAYDANVDPSGYVADVRTTSIVVNWLYQRQKNTPDPSGHLSEDPRSDIERDILDSGDVHVYDRTMSSNQKPPNRIGLDVSIGDKVRFRDLAGASLKYDGTQSTQDGVCKLNRIPKGAALGYDINTFLIARTNTRVAVLWQDLSRSEHSSTDLVPFLDVDDDDEVWPGELVTTRKGIAMPAAGSAFQPEAVGVVQSVNAKDRIAQVKWFPYAQISFAGEANSILLPGSYTGVVNGIQNAVSLYDVWTVSGLARRLGDYVFVLPMNPGAANIPDWYRSICSDANVVAESSTTSRDWLGEVVELGLDGLLTIRLGASSNVRDVRMPWECTFLAHSTDLEPSDNGLYDTSESSSLLIRGMDADGQWRDENDQIIHLGSQSGNEPGEDHDWTTDDDDETSGNEVYDEEKADSVDSGTEAHMKDDGSAKSTDFEGDTHMQDDIPMEHNEAVFPPSPSPHAQETSVSKFSYSSMFGQELCQEPQPNLSHQKPQSFAILEGGPPTDHHYVNQSADLTGQRLRPIQKEHKILQSSLPDGVYVRTWESALDLLRVLILGPIDTPYEYAPFVIDLYLDATFPTQPPQAFFHSWTDNTGCINPNLYEDGKICLSLLGTWPGDKNNETWSPTKSTILQILVSLLGLVLVKEPYYNEAGYEVRLGTIESLIPSALYSERTYFKSRAFIAHALRSPIAGFEPDLAALYTGGPMLLIRAIWTGIMVIRRSEKTEREGVDGREGGEQGDGDGEAGRRVSAGALIPLRRQMDVLVEVLAGVDEGAARGLGVMLRESGVVLKGGPNGVFDELSGDGQR